MRKISYFIVLLFVFSLAACQQNEELAWQEGGEQVFSLTPQLPIDVTTRASISVPSTHQLRCILEVWSRGEAAALAYREEKTVTSGTLPIFKFKLERAAYTCLFWVDFLPRDAAVTEVTTTDGVKYHHYTDACFDTKDLKTVSIMDMQKLLDTDLCDGFYANLQVDNSSETLEYQVELIRPFAKLTLKEADETALATLTGFSTEFDVAASFNVALGEPLGTKKTVKVEKNFEAGSAGELFSCYVFTPSNANGISLGQMDLAFSTTEGNKKSVLAAGTIGLKRNDNKVAQGNLMAGGSSVDPDDPVLTIFKK